MTRKTGAPREQRGASAGACDGAGELEQSSGLRQRWRPRSWSLRARLLAVVLLAVLPALAALVDLGLEQRHHAIAEAREATRRLAERAAERQAYLIEEGRRLLMALAEVPPVRDASRRGCEAFVTRVKARDERFVNFGVMRLDGEIVCSAVPLANPVNVADRPYFRRVLAQESFVVSDYVVGRITNRPLLILVMPARDPDGRVKSVVYAGMDLAWLGEFAAQSAMAAGSLLTVLDKKLTVLARNPHDEALIGRRAPEPLAAIVAQEGKGDGVIEAAGPDGTPYLHAVAHLAGLPQGSDVHVVVSVPARHAYGHIDRLLARNLTLLGLLFVLVIALTWLGSEALVLRRARLLAKAAQRLGAGDLSARSGIEPASDELSAVGATFDRMAEALERRVREANEHTQRIARLNRIYAVLSGINAAILRIREREALLKEVCRIAVEIGGFRLAWVGLADEAHTRVRPVASAGAAEDYIEDLRVSLDPTVPEGRGPTAVAVREGRHVVCNDILRDPTLGAWHERARALGFAASGAFPLWVEGTAVGALNLYAAEAGFFDAEEVALLSELAADTSLGLEHIENVARLDYLAYHDPLTGLANLRLFTDRLAQALARQRHHERLLAVVAFDLEGFRDTVHAAGQRAGDQVLRAIARYLAGEVREGDTVARLEADEFGVVLTDIARLEDVMRVVDGLVQGFPRSLRVGAEDVFLKVHAGVAVYPADGKDAETLLQHARLAGRAKREDAVSFYAHGLDAAIQEQRKIERALRQALETQVGLALHYQPVVDLATRKLIGLEALVRWTSPELGSVSPATFIPVAEAAGLIVPLGEWVLRAAARQLAIWRAQGRKVGRTAVNVSVRQLKRKDFVERFLAILTEAGLDPATQALAVEITESELMDHAGAAIAALRELKTKGIAVYVDDFGTGYSSLGYLQKLPIDVLKIDQGFVRGIETAPESAAIARTIVALAKSLNLKVIAEGVETESELEALRELGCDAAQGYLFSTPVTVEQVPALLVRLGPT